MAATVQVGSALGAGQIEQAKLSAIVSMICAGESNQYIDTIHILAPRPTNIIRQGGGMGKLIVYK